VNTIIELIKKLFKIKFVRYLFTGGTLFIIDFICFYILNKIIHIDIRISQMISRTVGATVGFLLQKVFVFENYEKKVSKLSFQGFFYVLLVIFNIFFSGFLIFFLEKIPVLNINVFVLKVFNEIIMVTETYIFLNLIFWRKKDVQSEDTNTTDNN